MKKRLLALVVAIALLLCGCCTCDTQVDMSRYLYKLLESNDYNDWLNVATCKNATLDHLLNCAQKCASIKDTSQRLDDKASAINIAEALISNKKATSEVVKELANSEFREVWKVIASATCNDSDSLVVLAQKCASIKDTTQFLDDKAFATDFAKKLTHHSEFNAKVGIALTASPFSEVKNIALIALESLENS